MGKHGDCLLYTSILKENGGYIFAADHSIPNDVPFENMKAIIALVKELGRFD